MQIKHFIEKQNRCRCSLLSVRNHAKAAFDVLGNLMLKRPPESRRQATIRIGIAQDVSISEPNTTFPVIAPRRATAKLTAMAVDLQKGKKK